MDTPITRAEHEEFRKRLEDENQRQNKRLTNLENSIVQIQSLAVSVERLATNMEGMLKVQEKQGLRLEALEERDGAMWRKVAGYAATAVVGVIVGFIFKSLGM